MRNNSETDALHHAQQVDGPASEIEGNGGTERRSRMRSLSNTIGDLFRTPKRVRRESVDVEADVGDERRHSRQETRISRVDSSERDG
jgi:hypothetical protein